ncbi:MAG: methyltransferase domain-containing protein [Acidobacteria bacterium]|nr:methyltransferase domain-containing protein [Acidobacteriota bacterium]MCA1612430.1 methyltransferase domain-containing protein [Acidobacteriota bacterium]
MTDRVELFSSTYRHFTDPVSDAVRKETFGADIGQNSWLTVDEYERLLPWLDLSPDDHVLEVASGSGGPALYVAHATGCRVTGIDANESAVAVASQAAARTGASERVRFRLADATSRLPFDDESFDGLLCMDAMNHFPQRLAVFREWRRVLRPARRALFTDPVVITGPVTNDELARRSSIGLFLFVPSGVNERLIEEAGLRLVRQEDVTENAALIAGRWRRARQAHEKDLRRIEGGERFEGLQVFFEAVRVLTSERRLSRIAYVVEKPAA